MARLLLPLLVTALLVTAALVAADDAKPADKAAGEEKVNVDDVHAEKSGDSHGGDEGGLHEDAHDDEEAHQHDDRDYVVGSKQEAEEYSHLSEADAKKRLGYLINHMDANKDGIVDSNELYNWINSSMKSLDKEEADEKFNDTDASITEDGFITWPEYFRSSHGEEWSEKTLDDLKKTPEEAKKNDHLIKEIEEQRALFNEADSDHSGNLTRTEYYKFLHPWNYKEMHNVKVLHHLLQDDKNNDGMVDFQEFLGDDYVKKMKDDEKQKYKTEFEKYDVNKDGKLDVNEFKNYLTTLESHVPQIKEEVKHLINATDTGDRDGVLTKEEILSNFKVWVGSAPTDHPTVRDQFSSEYEYKHDPEEL